MLTGKQRSYLKSLANNIDSIFQVGKGGVSPEIVMALDDALEKRELIKITVLNNCEDELKEVASTICERTHANLVQIIGKKIIIYRRSKNNPTIEF